MRLIKACNPPEMAVMVNTVIDGIHKVNFAPPHSIEDYVYYFFAGDGVIETKRQPKYMAPPVLPAGKQLIGKVYVWASQGYISQHHIVEVE